MADIVFFDEARFRFRRLKADEAMAVAARARALLGEAAHVEAMATDRGEWFVAAELTGFFEDDTAFHVFRDLSGQWVCVDGLGRFAGMADDPGELLYRTTCRLAWAPANDVHAAVPAAASADQGAGAETVKRRPSRPLLENAGRLAAVFVAIAMAREVDMVWDIPADALSDWLAAFEEEPQAMSEAARAPSITAESAMAADLNLAAALDLDAEAETESGAETAGRPAEPVSVGTSAVAHEGEAARSVRSQTLRPETLGPETLGPETLGLETARSESARSESVAAERGAAETLVTASDDVVQAAFSLASVDTVEAEDTFRLPFAGRDGDEILPEPDSGAFLQAFAEDGGPRLLPALQTQTEREGAALSPLNAIGDEEDRSFLNRLQAGREGEGGNDGFNPFEAGAARLVTSLFADGGSEQSGPSLLLALVETSEAETDPPDALFPDADLLFA